MLAAANAGNQQSWLLSNLMTRVPGHTISDAHCADVIFCCKGQFTDITCLSLPLLLLLPGNPVSSDKRRKWCDTPKNLSGRQFSPDHVYTFHIWQHLIDFSTYNLSLGGLMNLDLTQFLNCQPLQLTCKDTHADEYMFSTLVWHEKLLYGQDSTATAASGLAAKLGKFSLGFGSFLGGSKK